MSFTCKLADSILTSHPESPHTPAVIPLIISMPFTLSTAQNHYIWQHHHWPMFFFLSFKSSHHNSHQQSQSSPSPHPSCNTVKRCFSTVFTIRYPDSKVHMANMGPTQVLSAPGGPHVGPMNLAIRATNGSSIRSYLFQLQCLTFDTLSQSQFMQHGSMLAPILYVPICFLLQIKALGLYTNDFTIVPSH